LNSPQPGVVGRNGAAGEAGARPGTRPAVELHGVTFGYLAGSPVLHAVSFAVRSGEHVALIGRTGAGKTSILSLVGGIYAPWSGEVRVMGRDPRALDPEERQRLIGVVPQMVQLFAGTVVENLTMFDPQPSRELVERAATIAGADAIVGGLPLGYDTPLSGVGRGGGVQLSSGQRQLLALARAIVWDPAVLLLDEATAAIDSASDAAFRASLRTTVAERGCAVLTIAHRLSTAREADRVIVLEAGRIVEEGPPALLERRGGQFAALLELEAAGWAWDPDVTVRSPRGPRP
jgi:ATP-binding cassette subfamily B protein